MSHGIADGLVLKVVRNNNFGLVATNIEEIKKREAEPILPEYLGEETDAPLYRHLLTSSFITTVEVFNEQVQVWRR